MARNRVIRKSSAVNGVWRMNFKKDENEFQGEIKHRETVLEETFTVSCMVHLTLGGLLLWDKQTSTGERCSQGQGSIGNRILLSGVRT